jgi:para-aminobenzoate synthetase component 1
MEIRVLPLVPFIERPGLRFDQRIFVTIDRPGLLRASWTWERPVSHLAALVGSWPDPAILESGPGFGAAGRWSVFAAHPRLVFESRDDRWTIRPGDGSQTGSNEALAALGGLLDQLGLAAADETPDADTPPFRGGLIGFYGYDLAPSIERLPRRCDADSRLPDIRFALYDQAITFDHATGTLDLWVADFLGDGPHETERRLRRLRDAVFHDESGPPAPSRLGRVESNFTKDAYLAAVGRALEYIRAGDIFQVNLAQRFEARGDVEPLDLYLRLRATSPAPFSALLRWDDLAVVSASPEWFYQTRGEHIITRPIKGTRPRGRTSEEDARLASELRASPKDRAELTMIVDLERNDLGRVCRYGSVRVTDPLTVETFAQVHHLVATVEGRLRAEARPIDIVRAVFPGGSITGAPKIRAMEIIDELEPVRRGLYTGAIGYYSFGASAFNIPIRTLIAEGDRAHYHVGGGIVADSDPEAEYEETLHKGRGLRAVLEGAGA